MTTLNPTTIPHGYYATPDPDQPDTITMWRSHATTYRDTTLDQLTPWPANIKYGPMLYRRDVPKDRTERDKAIREHAQRRAAWHEQIKQRIAADLDAARQLFATHAVRCTSCGRALTDDTSKRLGIGPECRKPEGPRYSDEEILGAIRNVVETTKPGDAARTWTWTRPIPGRARARETVMVSLRPDFQPKQDATGGSATCNSVFDRARDRRPYCTDPVVWKIERLAGNRTLTAYWCDADMPAEYRPDTAPAPLVEQATLFEETAS